LENTEDKVERNERSGQHRDNEAQDEVVPERKRDGGEQGAAKIDEICSEYSDLLLQNSSPPFSWLRRR
jgi:hypothetical protein